MKINITENELFYLEMLGDSMEGCGGTDSVKARNVCRKLVAKYKRAQTLNSKKNKENDE